MKPSSVKKYYRTGYNFNRLTGMSANTMDNWIRLGYVPFVMQKKVEKLTEGKLKARWDEKELD